MNIKKQKGYWIKKKETFTDGSEAKVRAKQLRGHEHIEHVQMRKVAEKYAVTFSVAKWYLEDLERAGIKL